MRASGALLLALAVAAARAEDPPATAGDSIAAAKKELTSIRAAASAVEAGPGLSGIDLREDPPGPGGARTDSPAALSAAARSAADPSQKGQGSGNWLVDAMERKPDQALSPRGREDPARGELDLLKGADRPDARAEKGSRLAEASDKAASKALAESVYNPLDAFMNSWISAHDREVLLPATRSDIPMAGELGRERAGTLPAVDLGQPGVFAEGAPPARDAGLADSKAATNPYVADIDLAILGPAKPISAPDLPGIAPFGLPDPSHGMSARGADPKSLDTSRSLIPDFAQAADDEKYFKQLKRF
jgi:hypothetical protein